MTRLIKQNNKQAGSTLLGVIVGLVIGLLVAVIVAMMIKNTSLPFANRQGKQDKPAEAGQLTDPNKPLYGSKSPLKDTVKDLVKKAEEEKSAIALPPEVKTFDPRLNAKLDSKPPIADKPIAEKPAADKTQKSDNGEEKFTYYLQAGAFLEQGDAENTKAKLALMGFSANIVERPSENGILYRVRMGPFSQLETMNRTRGRLTDNGVDVAVVRVPK
jgi:cell division protein FtsN